MAERRVSVRKIKEWIATLPPEYLNCRARGYHVGSTFWVDKGERQEMVVWLQHERCACGTERTRGVNRSTGRYVGGFAYAYPDGYQAPDDIGWGSISAEARGLYRLERINRFLADNARATFKEPKR